MMIKASRSASLYFHFRNNDPVYAKAITQGTMTLKVLDQAETMPATMNTGTAISSSFL